jgi:hypothetical protein
VLPTAKASEMGERTPIAAAREWFFFEMTKTLSRTKESVFDGPVGGC